MADYYSVIAHAVSRLPNKTDEAKQAIYERARAALRRALRSPFSETELVAEQAALEVAISMVEAVNDIATAEQLRRIAANIAKVPALLGQRLDRLRLPLPASIAKRVDARQATAGRVRY